MAKKFRSISIGIQGDGGLVLACGTGVGITIDWKTGDAAAYWAKSWGVGIVAGASVAPEIGFWKDTPKDQAGNYHGIEAGAAYGVGGEVGNYWNYKGDYLGFNVVPSGGVEVDIRYVRGHTSIT